MDKILETVWKDDLALGLEDEIITNLDMSNNAIALYVVLKTAYNTNLDYMCISACHINYLLTNKFNKVTLRIKERIEKGMNELSEYCMDKYGVGFEFIKGSNPEFLIPSAFLQSQLKSCTYVERSAIRKILSSKKECNTDPYCLLRMYLYIVYKMNNRGFYYGRSQKHKDDYVDYAKLKKIDIMDGTNFLPSRVTNYLKYFETKKILAVYRCGVVYFTAHSKLIQLPNLYARYSDKEKLALYGKRRDDKLADTKGKGGGVYRKMEATPQEVARKISLSRRFNTIFANFEENINNLDRDSIVEAYEYAKNKNDDLKNKIKATEESVKLSKPEKDKWIKEFEKGLLDDEKIEKLRKYLGLDED